MPDEPAPARAAAVRGVYRRNAAGFDARRSKAPVERFWIDRFLDGVPAGAPVLSLGCGAGAPIERAILAAGRPLTGVDFAPEMLAIARARFPDAAWIEADMRGLDLGTRFGGVIAWDSFFHLERKDQRAMFAVFARHAAPGASLMFTCGPRDGEAVGAVEGEPVYHASLSPAEYATLLEAHGFELRRFVAEDPECGGHTVCLARARSAL